ncbi:hypothetical protein JOD54_004290 [Actinokineospora baliensis]|uniref:hypothetical protein n=1 Tax=Actinokineospora baliensis TaxID=547056 RepID=UPI00195C057E|nr:hypothetical protein [Actinokineospora baliensis]MBM7774086.1 hypothetical protein [Actinokineospora baliensis]
MGRDHRDVVTKQQGTQHRMILRYEHERGSADAYCLARLVVRDSLPPVAVLTAFRHRDRPPALGYSGRPADALRVAVGDSIAIDWGQVVWAYHFGEFSDFYIEGAPENFVVDELVFFNGHYHSDLDTCVVYTPGEFFERYGELGLDPVPDVVQALGWRF